LLPALTEAATARRERAEAFILKDGRIGIWRIQMRTIGNSVKNVTVSEIQK
jgi:hypothetical protein